MTVTNLFLPGSRSVVRAPGAADAPERTEPFPGAKLTKTELHEELAAHGFSKEALARLEAARPKTYDGHRRCILCGHFHPNQGYALEHCAVCGFCRHAVVMSGVCRDCGMANPPFVELEPAHFDIHFLDEQGVVERVEKG